MLCSIDIAGQAAAGVDADADREVSQGDCKAAMSEEEDAPRAQSEEEEELDSSASSSSSDDGTCQPTFQKTACIPKPLMHILLAAYR